MAGIPGIGGGGGGLPGLPGLGGAGGPPGLEQLLQNDPILKKIKELLEKLLGGAQGQQGGPQGAGGPQGGGGAPQAQGAGGGGDLQGADPAIMEELLKELRKIAKQPGGAQALQALAAQNPVLGQIIQAATGAGFTGGGATGGGGAGGGGGGGGM